MSDGTISRGELNGAVRRALNLLDERVKVTGALTPHRSYYYELQGIIENAVHCGAQAATGDYRQLEGEPRRNVPPRQDGKRLKAATQ